jgi:DNA primase
MIRLPEWFKDTDDVSNAENWKEIFEWCIKNAKDAFIQVYELLREKYDMSSPIDKQKLFNDMFSLIICVDNYTIQEHYKQLLSEKVWLPYEILSEQFKKYAKTDGKFELNKKWKAENTPTRQPDREKICSSLFRDIQIFWKYISNPEFYTNLINFAKNIWENLHDDLLHKIFVNRDQLNQEEKLQLDELELRREKELESLSWDEKKMLLIKKLSLEYLQTKLKLILKSTTVSPEIKQKLLVDFKKI